MSLAGGPLDPSDAVLAVSDSPSGLLVTDGRHAGLWLCRPDGSPEMLSACAGAGRNVTVTDSGILFKECEGAVQRAVLLTAEGERVVLHESQAFSGPFPGAEGRVLLAEEGHIIEVCPGGGERRRWHIGEDPAWAALSGETVWYTGEAGGIRVLDIVTGDVAEAGPGEQDGRTFRRVEAGPGGMVLAEDAGGGFLVFRGEGGVALEVGDGLFPAWLPDGSVMYSALERSGLAPVGGAVMAVSPEDGAPEPLLEGPAALRPVPLSGGGVAWTDAASGSLRGFPGAPGHLEPAACIEHDSPAEHIEVPYMHQRWDTPNSFDGSWSCGPTSCLMATQYYRRLTPDSVWVSYPEGHWSEWGNYVPRVYTFLGYTYDEWGVSPGNVWVQGAHGYICREYGGAVWAYMVGFLEQHGISSAQEGTSWTTFTGEIDSRYPVVCSSSVLGYGHIILLRGYYEDHTVVVNDPFGDANESGWGDHYNGEDVLYDWPGYNNGHVEIGVAQLFRARSAVPSPPTTLVDDNSTGFVRYGDCRYWHMVGSGYDGDAWWTYSTGAPPDTCLAYWLPDLPGTGHYTVSVHVPPAHAAATGIYRVETTGGPVEVTLDQGDYSGEWAELGTWELAEGACLRLGDYTGTVGEHIAFDAARFDPVTRISDSASPFSGPLPVLAPNPATGASVIVRPPAPEMPGGRVVSVYDTAGRLVIEDSFEGDAHDLDVGRLAQGLYVVRVVTRGGPTATGKLTVAR